MPLNERYTRKGAAAAVTLTAHAGLLALLFFLFLPKALPLEEEMGIMVDLGDMVAVQGTFDPQETMQTEPAQPSSPDLPAEEALLTQETPDAPAITPHTERPKADPEDELRRREELKRQQAAEAERKRQEAIRRNVSGAFGSAGSTAASGETPEGNPFGKEGSSDGNVERGGADTGVGGFSSFSLRGRNLIGTLPRPSFSAQVEGTIVVQITVDPLGKVISTGLGAGTTISDYEMRESAMKAARQARFSEIDGINNQVGTITYRYRLK